MAEPAFIRDEATGTLLANGSSVQFVRLPTVGEFLFSAPTSYWRVTKVIHGWDNSGVPASEVHVSAASATGPAPSTLSYNAGGEVPFPT
jgi:hypothetical protein